MGVDEIFCLLIVAKDLRLKIDVAIVEMSSSPDLIELKQHVIAHLKPQKILLKVNNFPYHLSQVPQVEV